MDGTRRKSHHSAPDYCVGQSDKPVECHRETVPGNVDAWIEVIADDRQLHRRLAARCRDSVADLCAELVEQGSADGHFVGATGRPARVCLIESVPFMFSNAFGPTSAAARGPTT